MIRDGYSDIPPGKIATIVTFLDMAKPPPPRPEPAPAGLSLYRFGPGDIAAYRDLFRRVGERWMWFSRLALDDQQLAAFIGDAGVDCLALRRADRPVGLLELDFRQEREVEIVYFGLVEAEIGCGAGRWLMNRAIERAFAWPIRRLWLHTCHFDDPAALGFYLRSGFRPYRQAVEVADDPRLAGILPRDAMPGVPIFS